MRCKSYFVKTKQIVVTWKIPAIVSYYYFENCNLMLLFSVKERDISSNIRFLQQ